MSLNSSEFKINVKYDSKDIYKLVVDYEFTRDGYTRYVAQIGHHGVKKYRTLKDLDLNILKAKVEAQVEIWDNQYEKKLEKESKEINRENAEDEDAEVKAIQKELQSILSNTLEVDDTVDWEYLKNFTKFNTPKPAKPSKPKFKTEQLQAPPQEPQKGQYEYHSKFWEKLLPGLLKKRMKQYSDNYVKDINSWEEKVERINKRNEALKNEYEVILKSYEEKLSLWNKSMEQYKKEENDFLEKQNAHNQKVDKLKQEYQDAKPNAIEEYCEIVLNNSDYSEFDFPKNFELEYVAENSTLIIEYLLPAIEDIPSIKEVKFIAAKNEIKKIPLSQSALNKLYDSVVYQLILRSIHEIFEADVIDSIKAVVFNGWVNHLDKSTGQTSKTCITSVHTTKEEFLAIELSAVDPKLCFKGLKGVASTKLNSMTAITPIIQIEKNDSRFTNSRDIIDSLEEGNNLASMDWEDFEHLIRELFHKEFSYNGGEVKVTQSSRDGGVDAIAFDPDPIRGGKIVIQAKRYTNVVGVSAVRDLYGTTLNEGASKGIIVTTSDYGPDAYNFAKGKPLTLLNGGNLLYLLEKHGYKARINLKEAKENRTN
ncbi:restriction system protein [Zhouia amylolytica]|uniref:Restriction system protein n=1 Tax=Zhouia amylolytica TaxID=376730 RepID=A0A1I6VBM2_9FLAO|nr:restriction endonuclease [Zhouia amylolytica]SFT11052.1 restriction system protein [Zhouia amylolytica]